MFFACCSINTEGEKVKTAAISAKLVELASLLADRDTKIVAITNFVKNRWDPQRRVDICIATLVPTQKQKSYVARRGGYYVEHGHYLEWTYVRPAGALLVQN